MENNYALDNTCCHLLLMFGLRAFLNLCSKSPSDGGILAFSATRDWNLFYQIPPFLYLLENIQHQVECLGTRLVPGILFRILVPKGSLERPGKDIPIQVAPPGF
jgi:hypothetical protein